MLHLRDQAFTGSLPRPGRLLRNYDGSSMMSTIKRHTMTRVLITRESVLLKIHSLEKRQTARPLQFAQPDSMLMLMHSMPAAVLVIVRAFAAMKGIVGMIRAVRMLVRMSVLMGVGVAVGMRMDDVTMPVFMGMDVVMGMFVLVLVGMAVGLAMRMIVIAAVHAISPCKRSPRCYTIGAFLEHLKARLLARCCKSKLRPYAIAVQQPWNCSKSKRKRLRFSLSNNSCWGASACSLVFSLPVELE